MVGLVQGRRRSNAAGPHGTGRRPAPDLMQALRESLEEAREPQHLTDAELAEVEEQADAGDGWEWDNTQEDTPHALEGLETDYGTRFRCSCGEVSGYMTSRAAAEVAHGLHAAGEDYRGKRGGTEPLS